MPEDDPILQTRLDVAEMKGMLTQLTSAHTERLSEHTLRLDLHERRLNDKAKDIARHDERISDLEDDNTARSGKATALWAVIISGTVGIITVLQFLSERI